MSATGLRTRLTPAELRGPVRVLLRQHRRALWAACALLVLGIAFVVALRIWVASSYERCPDGDTTRCGDGTYLATYARTSTETFLADGGTALLWLAGLIGVFVAGPLIARELENGTFRFGWAQSMSPARWLAARIALPAALVTAGTTVLVLVYRWGRSGVQGPNAYGLDWPQRGVFPALGPVAVGYALLAVALGALFAVLVRRTLLSMGLTALVLGTVMLGFSKRRYELWPTARTLGREPQPNSWYTETGMLTPSGKELYWKDCFGTGRTPENFADCLTDRGGVTYFTDYHPASHFWPLQLVETAVLLALAAGAAVLAFRVLRRRHA
ncbi:ABC transporter permease [Streptomyces sp. ITFR-16]|uniref:ABC transporter permease n=1 Tax=Streptomyces sp. ITFR-16 TaxID=3075198 RepID=UPI002889062A|nr:ABC transporter permease [Streptomyces sp. ITFR-16]WNI23398.1 ABC transporter permease [Streptomyces sp. ITFR-16]